MAVKSVKLDNGLVEWTVELLDLPNNSKCHSLSNGTKQWTLNGVLHREDGPAILWSDGSEFWYLNGKQHRLFAPAVILNDGTPDWRINGELITKEVNEWMKDNNYQDYKSWTDEIKAEFILRFC